MRWGRAFCGVVVALGLAASLDSLLPPSGDGARVGKLGNIDSDMAHVWSAIALGRKRELLIADRADRDGGVLDVVDPRLPDLGSAPPGLVGLRPHRLVRGPDHGGVLVWHHDGRELREGERG